MLHQIRKMIGLMIAIVRGHTDMGTLEKAFSKEKVMIPTAPGLGLVLDKVKSIFFNLSSYIRVKYCTGRHLSRRRYRAGFNIN